jgi:hypothetical protein
MQTCKLRGSTEQSQCDRFVIACKHMDSHAIHTLPTDASHPVATSASASGWHPSVHYHQPSFLHHGPLMCSSLENQIGAGYGRTPYFGKGLVTGANGRTAHGFLPTFGGVHGQSTPSSGYLPRFSQTVVYKPADAGPMQGRGHGMYPQTAGVSTAGLVGQNPKVRASARLPSVRCPAFKGTDNASHESVCMETLPSSPDPATGLYHCTVPDCTSAFKRRYDLGIHQRVHTNERPHVCCFPECGAAFKTSGACSAHMRTHTGERPFVCQVSGCGASFSQKSSCNRHVRLRHGKRLHSGEERDES